MKKEEELLRDISVMKKETKQGKLKWKIEVQTTEYNDVSSKPTVIEDGIEWIVDECYVSYECQYKDKTFVMITYEMIHSSGDKKNTTNLVFLPALGIRYFDISTLLPYAVETSNVLIYEIHSLWTLLLDMFKEKNPSINLNIDKRELSIDEC